MDYNATTPLEPEVIQAITEALQDAWGNPSSSYIAGKGTFPFSCLLGTKPPQPLWFISRCESQSDDQPVQGERGQDGGRQSRGYHLHVGRNRGEAAVGQTGVGVVLGEQPGLTNR